MNLIEGKEYQFVGPHWKPFTAIYRGNAFHAFSDYGISIELTSNWVETITDDVEAYKGDVEIITNEPEFPYWIIRPVELENV